MRFNKKNLDLKVVAPRNAFEGSESYMYEFLKNSVHIMEGVNKINPVFKFNEDQSLSDQMELLKEICDDDLYIFNEETFYLNYELYEDKPGVKELVSTKHILSSLMYSICLRDVYVTSPKWMRNIIIDFYAILASEFVSLGSIIDQASTLEYDSDSYYEKSKSEFDKLKHEFCDKNSEVGLFCKAYSRRVRSFKSKTKNLYGYTTYDMKKYSYFLKRTKIHVNRVRRLKKAKKYSISLDLMYDIISLIYQNTVIDKIEIDSIGVSSWTGYSDSVGNRFYALFDNKYGIFLDLIMEDIRDGGYEIGEAADIYTITEDSFEHEKNDYAEQLATLFEKPEYDYTEKIYRDLQR